MKKNSIVIIVALLILLTPYANAFAQEPTTSLSGATPSASVEYTLPYPGILPNSPIYFLKAFRDRVIGFLVQDPLKKAEFNLQAADKRLSAGILLLDKGEKELATSTISKGENYFEFALRELEAVRNEEDKKVILSRLESASKKHQEVLEGMKEKTSEDLIKIRIEKELERVLAFQGRIISLKNLQK